MDKVVLRLSGPATLRLTWKYFDWQFCGAVFRACGFARFFDWRQVFNV